MAAARVRSPTLGGNFAVWGGLFSTFDCTLAKIRNVEDPWNAVISAGLTGGVLASRAGPRAMLGNAVVGMILISLIEGATMNLNRFIMKKQLGAGGKTDDEIMDNLTDPRIGNDRIPPNFGTGYYEELKRAYGANELVTTAEFLR